MVSALMAGVTAPRCWLSSPEVVPCSGRLRRRFAPFEGLAGYGAGSVESYTLARIDPASRRVVATVRLDARHLPGDLVIGDGAVWVFAGGGLLQRIDPVGNQVVYTLAVGPDGVDDGRLAVGAGAVWLSDAEARTLIRIDPQG
jgi:streptogramin lyase